MEFDRRRKPMYRYHTCRGIDRTKSIITMPLITSTKGLKIAAKSLKSVGNFSVWWNTKLRLTPYDPSFEAV